MITSGFFPSVNGDRKYANSFLAQWIHSFISSGVYNGDFVVAAGENMNVILPIGQAWINGYYCRNDGNITLPIANADGVLKRKDTIVLRWDINTRNITAQVLTGTFASNPIAPAIVRTAEQYDLKLAEIYISAGTTAITQAMVTDTRLDKTVCGIVTGVISQVDTTTLYNQIQADLTNFRSVNEADFTAWLANIKNVLDEETAGNLLNLINTHTADAAAHVTQEKQDKWDAGIVSTYIHTKTGTNHNLAGTGNNIEFLPTAGISDGDTWTVNGVAVTATLQNGDPLPADLFKSESWVTGVRLDGSKLNFKSAGGQTIEVFNFPLTIDTAQPTPIRAGHLWVNHANATDFNNVVLDDAVKVSYTNGSLMLIVDDTNNGTDNITQYKKVGTSKIPFTSVRDTANDTTLPWQTGSLNKSGNIIDIKRKYPLVYSRLNDVLDLETASVWDGTQWVLVSQQGSYLAVGTIGTPYSNLYNRTGSSLALHSVLPSFPSGQVNVVKWSKDGLYVFYGLNVSPWMVGYKRSGDSFSQITFGYHNTKKIVYDIDFSPDGNYLAVAQDSWLDIYKKQADGSWNFLNYIYSGSFVFYGCCWSPDSNYLTVTYNGSPFINRYKRTGDTFTLLSNPTTLPPTVCFKCKYSPDGNFVAVRTSASPYILCYHIISDTQWDKIANPTALPSSSDPFAGLAFTPSSGYLFVANLSASTVLVYTYSSTGLVYVKGLSISGVYAIAISSDGTKIACGGNFTAHLVWYSLVDTTLTPLANPTTLPTSIVNSLDFLN